jgi:hypothetical protein
MLNMAKSPNLLDRTKNWLKNQVIQEIPPNLSPCEFDCHQPYCTYGNAATCKKCQILNQSNR